MRLIESVCCGLAAAAMLLGLSASASAEVPRLGEPFTPIDAATEQAAMGGGVNVLGYDPGWHDAAKWRFQPELFRTIHAAGFKTVRIAVQAFDFLGADGKFDPQ